MIRFSCPTCQAKLEMPENAAGTKVRCPGCNQKLMVPLPPADDPRNKTVLALSEPPVEEEPIETILVRQYRPRRRMRRKSSSYWVLWVIPLIAVPILAVCGFCFLSVLVAPRAQNNARCPVCGREFRIPEEHRGNMAQWTRDYSCPNCGVSFPAALLYKND